MRERKTDCTYIFDCTYIRIEAEPVYHIFMSRERTTLVLREGEFQLAIVQDLFHGSSLLDSRDARPVIEQSVVRVLETGQRSLQQS